MSEGVKEQILRDFLVEKKLKSSERSEVWLVRCKADGRRRIYRWFFGESAVYEKLMGLSSPYLPVIEVVEQEGDTVHVLEEFIQGEICSYDAILDSRCEPLFESMTVWPPVMEDRKSVV